MQNLPKAHSEILAPHRTRPVTESTKPWAWSLVAPELQAPRRQVRPDRPLECSLSSSTDFSPQPWKPTRRAYPAVLHRTAFLDLQAICRARRVGGEAGCLSGQLQRRDGVGWGQFTVKEFSHKAIHIVLLEATRPSEGWKDELHDRGSARATSGTQKL